MNSFKITVSYVAAFVAGVVVAAVLLFGSATANPTNPSPKPYIPTEGVPACVSEDGNGLGMCIWDGEVMGNGTGELYMIVDGYKIPMER